MAWTSPLTWAVGQLVTAAQMNIHVRDNLQFLYDRVPGSSKIADQILLVDTASPITFSSIPGTYRHLSIVANVRSTRVNVQDPLLIRVNGDSSAIYNYSSIAASSAAVGDFPLALQTSISVGNIAAASASAGRASPVRLLIPDYARTVFHKQLLVETSHIYDDTPANWQYNITGGVWRNTAAITSVSFTLLTGPNFLAGSTFTLYGLI